MTRVVYSVDIAAPAQEVFNAVVDWRGQDRWVPLTTVRAGHKRELLLVARLRRTQVSAPSGSWTR